MCFWWGRGKFMQINANRRHQNYSSFIPALIKIVENQYIGKNKKYSENLNFVNLSIGVNLNISARPWKSLLHHPVPKTRDLAGRFDI